MADRPLFDWLKTRGAGVLLHPTCLPGGQGIGTFDGNAERFLDFLQAAGMAYWQICPLGPTGYGDSPYQCFSAFAGNPYLVDLRALVDLGLVEPEEIAPLGSAGDAVDFGSMYRLKLPLILKAFVRYAKRGCPPLGEESFEHGLLEYPHYTRPQLWRDGRWREWAVPEVLLSGHHERIRAWRLARAEEITRERRPDLWARRDRART